MCACLEGQGSRTRIAIETKYLQRSLKAHSRCIKNEYKRNDSDTDLLHVRHSSRFGFTRHYLASMLGRPSVQGSPCVAATNLQGCTEQHLTVTVWIFTHTHTHTCALYASYSQVPAEIVGKGSSRDQTWYKIVPTHFKRRHRTKTSSQQRSNKTSF
eukprot:2861632-Amphidinium_carterae.2